MYQTIVSTQTLATQIKDPDWVVFDCRFDIKDKQKGLEMFAQSHIVSAQYVSLDDDMASLPSESSGRHPLPNPDKLSRKLASLGMNQNSQAIVYDQSNGSTAVRLWWLIRWLGHPSVAVLDGGLDKWSAEGLPMTDVVDKPGKGDFKGTPDDSMWVSTKAIEDNFNSPDVVIVDARSPARFSGKEEPVDSVGGHIPGAINHPLTNNVDENGCFLSPEKLRVQYEPLQKRHTIHSCGSGVTACHNLLAMEMAGLGGSKLYVGSWSEWIRSPQRPIEKGE